MPIRGERARVVIVDDHPLFRHGVRYTLEASGEFDARRKRQAVTWMNELLDARIRHELSQNKSFTKLIQQLETEVREGAITPSLAVDQLARTLRIGRR